jgi:hypothetical protein
VCIDSDGDGHGFQCELGEDCDDADSTLFEGCDACARASEGCECEANAAPVECTLPKQLSSAGMLLCKTGTRYCRDGAWSACEGIKSFEAPPPSRRLSNAIIEGDAAPVICDDCNPDCYQITDPLAPVGDASLGPNVLPGTSGGITLSTYVVGGPDGGAGGDGGLLDDGVCIHGTAPDFDCDGIPDTFDEYPGDPPFASDHKTIFMDLGPGDQQSETFDIQFYLNTADIYLYLDMTSSMNQELINLIDSLRNGNFMANGGVGVECADRNFNGDTSDEEYLKNEGVAGNLACMIRDSRLGTGWHRDLPFPRPDSAGFGFGPHDFEAFQHEQDITDNVDLVLNALGRFRVRGGINRPEGGIMGLYALATGTELYMGWDRPGNPAPVCPAGTWGYGCFRDDAVPIIIWMTDAPVTNGPATTQGHLGLTSQGNRYGATANQLLNWDASAIGIEMGSDGKYNRIGNTHETFASALVLDGIHDSFKTYAGDTTGMAANLTYASTGACGSGTAWSTAQQAAPDAVFRLSVTDPEPITISTRGSRFQTTLAIIDSDRIDSVPTTTVAAAGNALPTAAQNLGTLTFPSVLNVTGSNYGAAATFSRDALGCLTGTGATDKIGASVLRFNLADDVAQLRVVSDAPYALATNLFSARPGVLSADTSLATAVWTYGAGTRTGNANDYFGSYNVGNMTGAYRRFTSGDTSDADLSAQLGSAMFQTGSCTGVSGSSNDAMFDFSLSAATRLRIEGTGLNSTLQAGFDHVIALVQRSSVPHTGITGNTSDSSARAIDLSEVPVDSYSWSQYNGTLGGVSSQYSASELGPFVTPTSATDCNNAAASTVAGFQGVFTIDTTGLPARSYDFDTAGSAISTYVSLHEDLVDTQRTLASTNSNNANAVQAIGAIDELSMFVTGGSLATHGTAAADFVNASLFGCAAGNGGRDAIYSFTVAAAQTVSVRVGGSTGSVFNPGDPGFNSYVAVFQNSLSAANRIAGSCTDQGGTGQIWSEETDINVVPGVTYYVVVKAVSTASLTTTTGAYRLWVRDTSFSSHFLDCDYGSQPNGSATIRAAKLTRTLQGNRRYYVVVRGATTSAAAYQLNVRRTPTSDPTALACDRDSAGDRHSVIDQTLPAGNYSVIIRGYTAGDEGAYNLIFRDMGVAPGPVACQYDPNNTSPVPLTLNNLPARDGGGTLIDYYLVMRGNTSTGSSTNNAYTIRLEDGSLNPTQCAFDNVTMMYSQVLPQPFTDNDDIGNAEWTGSLPIGDYYVVLKGVNTTQSTNTEEDDWGMYQLTVGDQTNFEQFGTFAAERWLGAAEDGTTGVRKALLDRQIRVITVDSTSGSGDDATYSDQQLRTIAQATDAVALDGTPLFFKINSDGTGMGATIVEAVNQLAGNLAMDVGVRLVEEPDSPAPRHFRFLVRAVDMPGDSCDAPVNRDGDTAGVVDTHVNCRPGAVPRFEVTFSNPTPPNSVPANPTDPNGGYNMRLELIGDGQYVVDEIPVYIIPEDVVENPGDDRFNDSGSYEQTISASGCFGTESPLWKELSWSADLPSGTSLVWSICTADTVDELAGCTLETVATVRTGGTCSQSSDCMGGYCVGPVGTSVCEYATGPTCTADQDCGLNGACVTGTCAWTANPIDVKPAVLRSLQGKQHARVQVTLNANAARTRAPTVHSWGLKYTCTAQE